MLVKDLITKLKPFKDKEIVFSQDEEGNAMMNNCELAEEEGLVVLFPYEYIDAN